MPGIDLLDVMTTTPMTREFSDGPLPDSVLYSIADHDRFAPNGGSRQAWHVTVVREAQARDNSGRWPARRRWPSFPTGEGPSRVACCSRAGCS
jgi:Nitroreductase family